MEVIGKVLIVILCFAIIGGVWGLIQYITHWIFRDK